MKIFTESELKQIDFRIVTHCKEHKLVEPDEVKTKRYIAGLADRIEKLDISLETALDRYFPIVNVTVKGTFGSKTGNRFASSQNEYHGGYTT